MNHLYEMLSQILGLELDPKNLSFLQISLRGVIVFIAALTMVRVADKRFLGKMTALDAILGFILASVLARAVNGSVAFFPTLGAGFVIVFFHRLLAALSYRFEIVDRLTKGDAELLIKDGRLIESVAKRNHITEKDLLEELRLNGNVEEMTQAKVAFIERSGEVSVVPSRAK
jgi:uncharacterized membrane protein YcaP (DUF421 family)